MSHISTIKTVIKDREALKLALASVGCKDVVDVGNEVRFNFTVRSAYGETTRDYSFIEQPDGTFTFEGDMWLIEDQTQKMITDLTQQYGVQVVMSQLGIQGFQMDDQQVDADGNVHLVLNRR